MPSTQIEQLPVLPPGYNYRELSDDGRSIYISGPKKESLWIPLDQLGGLERVSMVLLTALELGGMITETTKNISYN